MQKIITPIDNTLYIERNYDGAKIGYFMAKDLYSIAKKKGIKYFFISFVDFFGVMRSKLVPLSSH